MLTRDFEFKNFCNNQYKHAKPIIKVLIEGHDVKPGGLSVSHEK